jgi:sugar phosphate isomerase/epimerase
MLTISRRTFIGSGLAAGILHHLGVAGREELRIGVTDWNLNLGADPDAVALAADLGFDAIQLSFGRKLVNNKLPLDNSEIIASYIRLASQHNISIDGTSVDKLLDSDLKSDPAAPKWVLDAIRLTRALNARVLLLPFFGHSTLSRGPGMDHVGDVLRDLGPEATRAGVFLGLENMLSAEDNVRIMERSRSASVRVYYDVGNSTAAGFDPVKEIRWLGKDRICQFHFKDNPHYLGAGTIQFAPILQAIQDIQFSGFANLETDSPSGNLKADMRKNLAYIRSLMASA